MARTPACAHGPPTTKNRLEAVLPLHGDVVDAVKVVHPEHADADDLVFNAIPSVSQLRKDLVKAGIVYKDRQGRQADFHSLRYTFGTNLGRAGVQPRVAMELMRHADMRLTMNIYTDASKLPTSTAVASLPSVLPMGENGYAQGNAQNDAQNSVPRGSSKSAGVVTGPSRKAATEPNADEQAHAKHPRNQGKVAMRHVESQEVTVGKVVLGARFELARP